METVKEKRRCPRISVVTLADVTLADRFFYDYTVTVGETGMYLETTQDLDPGTTIEIRFVMPKVDHVFQVEATVRWRNKNALLEKTESILKYQGVGIEFIRMSDESKSKLKGQLDNLSKTII